jgi:hypothetical protein
MFHSNLKGSKCDACGYELTRDFHRIPTCGRCNSSGPGLAQKAMNFAKAAAQHIAAGSPQATDRQVEERFAICKACELYSPKNENQGTCRHTSCGCALKTVGVGGKNKLRWADQECPLKKWLAVKPGADPAL